MNRRDLGEFLSSAEISLDYLWSNHSWPPNEQAVEDETERMIKPVAQSEKIDSAIDSPDLAGTIDRNWWSGFLLYLHVDGFRHYVSIECLIIGSIDFAAVRGFGLTQCAGLELLGCWRPLAC